MIRRVAKHEPLLEAHRSHVYQRITALGFAHRQVALFTALMSFAIGSLFLVAGLSTDARPFAFAGGVLLLTGYLAVPSFARRIRG